MLNLTLRDLKLHLRLDEDDHEEDEYLASLLETAKAILENECRRKFDDAIPPPIRHAALLLIGHFYENREATSDRTLTELPFAVRSLIAPYRRLVQ